MYDAAQVRERFLQEVNRLIELQVVENLHQMEKRCDLTSGVLWNIQAGRTKSVPTEILAKFVMAFREQGVSYEYILEGKPQPHVLRDTTNIILQELNKDLHKAIEETIEREREKWRQHLK